MRAVSVLAVVLLRSFTCEDSEPAYGPPLDAGDRPELSFCPGVSLPPDAGVLCTSTWYCKGLGQSACAPAESCGDAGPCGQSCMRAADCACGSCVDRACQPRPGVCTGDQP